MRRTMFFITVAFAFTVAQAQSDLVKHVTASIIRADSIGQVRISEAQSSGTTFEFSSARAVKKDLLNFQTEKSEAYRQYLSSKIKSGEKVPMSVAANATGINSWVNAEPPLKIPPSPTAASLINQSKETVDLYTGKVNVSVPLYSLKSVDIEVPVELSYNTAGVRVDDVAGWVGTSWSLNAGGSISRVMRGLPDEFQGKVIPPAWKNPVAGDGYGYLNIKSRGVNLSNFSSEPPDKQKKIIKFADWMALDGLDMGNIFSGAEAWDTEPDEFYFSFGKYSGKFVFDQDGNINFLPNQNFRIAKNIQQVNFNGKVLPKIVEFIIYTDDGYKYTFGDASLASVEQTQIVNKRNTLRYFCAPACSNSAGGNCVFPGTGPTDPLSNSLVWFRTPLLKLISNVPDLTVAISAYEFFTSTWYLREIQAPSGDVITLNYSTPDHQVFYVQSKDERVRMPNTSEIQFVDNRGQTVWLYISPPGDLSPKDSPQEVTFSTNILVIDSRKLASIKSGITGPRVEFVPQSAPREDLLGDQALESINIFNSNNSLVRSFKLHYSYQVPDIYEQNTIWFIGMDQQNQALFLREYDVTAEANEIIQSEQKRMFLDKIVELGSNGVGVIPAYEFTYNAQVLPRRGSYRQDRWGYFNSNDKGTKIPPLNNYTGFFGDAVGRSGMQYMIWDLPTAPKASWLGATLNVDGIKGQAGILTKVRYPAGGSKEFIYESNKTDDTNTGGFRVKEIRTFSDGFSSNFTSEFFSYSAGVEVNRKLFKYSLATDIFGHADVFGSSNSVVPLFSTKGGSVGYRTVKVSQPGNGKTIHTFKTPSEVQNVLSQIYPVGGPIVTNVYPYPQDMDKDWQRGLLEESKVTLDDESKILRREAFDFNLAPSVFTPGYVYGLTPGLFYVNGFEQYRAGIYKYESGWLDLETHTTTEYDNQKPGIPENAFTKSTSFQYAVKPFQGRQYIFLQSQTSMSPDNQPLVTEYRYPLDVDNYIGQNSPTDPVANAIHSMAKKDGMHMISTPIEVISYKNGNVLQSMVQTFKGFPDGSAKINPYQTFLTETNNPILPGSFTKFSVTSAGIISKSSSSKLFNTMQEYDDVGNIRQYTGIDGIPVTILYGYKKQYPVAEIRNATYQEVLTVLSQSVIDQLNTSPGTDASLRSKLQPLRSAASLAKAFVTIYTYAPLVGVTSVTDSNGVTSYYEYDSSGRLRIIKDVAQNILKIFDYNYQVK